MTTPAHRALARTVAAHGWRRWMGRVECCDWRDLVTALPAQSVDLVLTDMPYGTTACAWDTVIDLDAWWREVWRVVKPRAAVVCTASQPFTTTLISSAMDKFRYEWVLVKQQPSGFLDARRKPLKAHETAVVFGMRVPGYYPQGLTEVNINNGRKNKAGNGVYGKVKPGKYIQKEGNFPRSILKYNWPTYNIVHPTQKPVALFEYLIRTYTEPGALVLDPFVGSGTTAIAARNTGRRYIVGDLSPEYVAIARERLDTTPYRPRVVDDDDVSDLPLFAGVA